MPHVLAASFRLFEIYVERGRFRRWLRSLISRRAPESHLSQHEHRSHSFQSCRRTVLLGLCRAGSGTNESAIRIITAHAVSSLYPVDGFT